MYVHTYTHIHKHTYIQPYVHEYTLNASTLAYLQACITYMKTSKHAYSYTSMDTNKHAYIHMQTLLRFKKKKKKRYTELIDKFEFINPGTYQSYSS